MFDCHVLNAVFKNARDAVISELSKDYFSNDSYEKKIITRNYSLTRCRLDLWQNCLYKTYRVEPYNITINNV